MKIENVMKFKAMLKKIANDNKISSQIVLQTYMLERLLERISLSKYSENFIIKGGFLISSIVGLLARSTMDMDTTIKGLPLTLDSANHMLSEIIKIPVDDGIKFNVEKVTEIREADDYSGFRVSLLATLLTLNVPLTVDITTGDVITPGEVRHSFKLLFEDRSVFMLAYPFETILAEKIETILSRRETNTRMRDFYDVYLLWTLHNSNISIEILREAIQKTMTKRKTLHVLSSQSEIIASIKNNQSLVNFWDRYKQKQLHGGKIDFNSVCETIENILEKL